MRAEQLLNTKTTNATVWGHVLPAAPPPPAAPVVILPRAYGAPADTPNTGTDGISLALQKSGDDVTLTWVGTAARLLKSFSPTLAAGVCLAVSGNSAIDSHQLSVPASSYYAVGAASLCSPDGSPSAVSMSPPSGSSMGGYPATLLGTGFDATVKVRIGWFQASQVVVVNATTLTFRVPPGNPGATAVTVINGAGQTATTTFTYTDPGPIPGGVAITAPADGTVVVAGSTIAVSASGSGGFTIAQALASNAAFASSVDLDPGEGFTANVTVPADVIGRRVIELVAKDASSNFKTAVPVTINVVAPGNVTLLRLDAAKLALLHATPTGQLRVYGIYSDGIKRELTHAPGILYEMDTQDLRKPNYPYNGTGVAVVDGAGMVTATARNFKSCTSTRSAILASDSVMSRP